jgi:lipopolysaccharide assembly outer membrane protein LptD (OstA)
MQRFSAAAVFGTLVLACLVQGQSAKAQSAVSLKNGFTLAGNVVLTDGRMTIQADRAVLNSDMKSVALTGNVRVSIE